jgi:hypothetical protein
VDERVWVEAGEGVAAAAVADLSSAIRLRLSGWSVEPRPEGLAAAGGAWVVRLRLADAALVLDVVEPRGADVVTGERLPGETGGVEQARHGAVVVALAVSLGRPEPARSVQTRAEDPKVAEPAVAPPTPKKTGRSTTIVEAGVAPGVTVGTGDGGAVFGVAVGARVFVAGDLAVEAGARISMAWEGAARGDTARVADRAFWLGPAYRLRPARMVGIDLGVALQYTWPVTDIPTDSRFSVSEGSPAARFSPRVSVRGTWRFVDHVAVTLSAAAVPTFSRRTYRIRGDEAVDLGYATVDALAGVDACF